MRIVRKYVVLLGLLFIFLQGKIFSQTQWIRQNSQTSTLLRKCIFVDSLYGWAIGDSGIIVGTFNGGNNWNTQSKIPSHYLLDIFFLNRNRGWVIAWFNNGINYGSLIYKTTNSGINWSYNVYPDTNLYLTTIFFLDNNKGFLGATSNIITLYYSINGGINWIPCGTDSNVYSNFPVRKIIFFNQNTGFAVGGYFDIAGVIWKTTNSGLNWTSQVVGGEPLNHMIFIDSIKYIVSGGDFEYGVSVSRTTNSGINWIYEPLNYFGIGYGISFRKITDGYISTGFGKMFIKSTDAGNNWFTINTPDNSSIYDIIFLNEKYGWCVGDSGVIYKFNYNYSVLNELIEIIPDNIINAFNFPNPFNSATVLKFILKEDCLINLKIYDVNGKEMNLYYNNKFNAGVNIIKLNFNGYPSGIYFYKLNSTSTKSGNISKKSGKLLLIN